MSSNPSLIFAWSYSPDSSVMNGVSTLACKVTPRPGQPVHLRRLLNVPESHSSLGQYHCARIALLTNPSSPCFGVSNVDLPAPGLPQNKTSSTSCFFVKDLSGMAASPARLRRTLLDNNAVSIAVQLLKLGGHGMMPPFPIIRSFSKAIPRFCRNQRVVEIESRNFDGLVALKLVGIIMARHKHRVLQFNLHLPDSKHFHTLRSLRATCEQLMRFTLDTDHRVAMQGTK
ncbi:hypothetical protein KC347_g125 [Hortaea werneckii]|nr:hypothetical protein KC347_g125 [Hortaea werneckii]